ncbi:MAG TPA: alpha/beta hydrolase [Croceibacterium sp.]|nr:alpha/beta hydrolase [Croceibacterium sp.]
MTRSDRTAFFTLAALAAALALPQGLPAQTPGDSAPAANGPPRMPRMAPDPRVRQESYTLPTGEEMKYTLFVSSKVKPGVPAPLVVALHGYGGDSNFIVRDRLVDLAERDGYVVVGPMGYNFTGWYGSPVILIGGGEVKPPNLTQLSELDVLNVLAIAQKQFDIDPNRIYLMGHSMGGAGTIFLGQKHSEIWAAAAAIAPAAFMMQPNARTLLGHFKDAKLPLMITQGDADAIVPPAGTRTWAAAMDELGMEHAYIEKPGLDHGTIIGPSMDDIFAFFAAHKHAPPPPFVSPRPPGNPPARP